MRERQILPPRNRSGSKCVNHLAVSSSPPPQPLARLCRPRAEAAPLGFLALGDLGPWRGGRRAQPRRLFSSSPRRLSGTRCCLLRSCYQKRPFSPRSAWRRAQQQGDARFSPGLLEGRASWLQGCQAKSTIPPTRRPNAATKWRGGHGDQREAKEIHIPNVGLPGYRAPQKAKWEASLLLPFRAGFSEDASSDGRLGRQKQ